MPESPAPKVTVNVAPTPVNVSTAAVHNDVRPSEVVVHVIKEEIKGWEEIRCKAKYLQNGMIDEIVVRRIK